MRNKSCSTTNRGAGMNSHPALKESPQSSKPEIPVGMPIADKTTMRIAIAHWQGRISPVFDISDRLLLIDMENGRQQWQAEINLNARDPFERAKQVSRIEADVLVCGAISHALETALVGFGVQVVGFIRGNLEAVIAAFIRGQLMESQFQMPGIRRKHGNPELRHGGRTKGPSTIAKSRRTRT
jgi:predicted Fe-Mo cluster-binding NifX family protein